MTSVVRVVLLEGDAFMRFAGMRLRFSIGMNRESFAVELEQVGRVEHCGGVVPVSADEVENGEAASVRRVQAKEWGRSISAHSHRLATAVAMRRRAPLANGAAPPARHWARNLLGVRRLFGSVLAGRIRRRG
jgi:hypothetical protein